MGRPATNEPVAPPKLLRRSVAETLGLFARFVVVGAEELMHELNVPVRSQQVEAVVFSHRAIINRDGKEGSSRSLASDLQHRGTRDCPLRATAQRGSILQW